MVEINKVGFAKEYRFNLVAAMNTVAVRVAKIVSSGSNALNTSGQQRLLLRSSRVLVLSAYALPSTLKSVNNTSCPIVQNLPVTTDTSTLCQKVTAQIRFNITKGANQNDTARLHSMFVSDLIQSISNGELQTELDALLWSSGSDPVTVLTGRQTKPAVEANTNNGGSSGIQANESSTSLSPGAITGISLAATLLILPLVYLLLTRRKPYDDGKAKNTEQVEYRPDAADDDLQNRSQADSSTLGTDAAHFGGNGVVGGATTLGAAQACYGFGSGGGGGKNESGKTLNDEDEYEDDDYDNGSRTHMEWRSSAGISSLTMRSTGVGLASALSRDKKDDDPARYARVCDGLTVAFCVKHGLIHISNVIFVLT